MGIFDYLYIIIHNKHNLVPSWKELVGAADKLMFHTTEKFYLQSLYTFSKKKIFLLNTKSNPCQSQSEYKVTTCLNEAIMKRLSCQLPWLTSTPGK